MTPLCQAIELAVTHSKTQLEEVHMVSARSLDFANRWFRVEGTRRAYRRTYIVDMLNRSVAEILGVGPSQTDDDLILIAQRMMGAVK